MRQCARRSGIVTSCRRKGRYKFMLLEGKVAVVTGGTRGIGFEIVRKYLSNGGSRLFYGTNIILFFYSNNFTGLNASVTLRKFPSLSFGTMETTG